MKITQVEPVLLRGDTAYGARSTAGEATDNGDWQLLIRVATDEGLTGWADVETLAPAAVAIIAGAGMSALGFRTLGELLFGENPLDVERLWDKLYIGSAYYGRRGIAMHCISAIDNALWSIRAQAAGMSLARLLGGRRRDSITAYASTLFRETPEAMAEAVRGYIEHGFRAVKFGWGVFGQDTGRDRELVAAARDALGPDCTLLIDPGWYPAGWKTPGRCAAGVTPKPYAAGSPTTTSAGSKTSSTPNISTSTPPCARPARYPSRPASRSPPSGIFSASSNLAAPM